MRVDGKAIWQLTALSVQEAKDYFDRSSLLHADNGAAERDRAVADKILKEIQQRLTFLSEVGLPYLTLDRRADTLSGGKLSAFASRPSSDLTSGASVTSWTNLRSVFTRATTLCYCAPCAGSRSR